MNVRNRLRPVFRALVLTLAMGALAANGAKPMPTVKCGTWDGMRGIHAYGPNESVLEWAEMLANARPELQRRLWNPIDVQHRIYPWGKGSVLLRYPDLQDLGQILEDVKPLMSADGFEVYFESVACRADVPMSHPHGRIAQELRHRASGEFRVVFSPEERRELLSHGDWELTGEQFPAPFPNACRGLNRVAGFRAIGLSGLGTQVLTVDPTECGMLRASGHWFLSDIPFHAWAVNKSGHGPICPYRSMPVMRLFNGSSSQPNHRYTTRQDLYAEMETAGWTGEGPAFCVPDGLPYRYDYQ